MSYTNKTEFYDIPLPIETDLYNPMDYNESMEAVDIALHGAVTNAATAVDTADAASAAAGEAVAGLEALSGTVNEEKGKLTALTARVTAAENEIDDVRADSNDMICAYNEPTATSTHAYSIGDYFIYNNVLYKATSAISIGDTIVPDTNCTTTNVTTEIKNFTQVGKSLWTGDVNEGKTTPGDFSAYTLFAVTYNTGGTVEQTDIVVKGSYHMLNAINQNASDIVNFNCRTITITDTGFTTGAGAFAKINPATQTALENLHITGIYGIG